MEIKKQGKDLSNTFALEINNMNTRGKGRPQRSGSDKSTDRKSFVKTTAAKRKPSTGKGADSFFEGKENKQKDSQRGGRKSFGGEKPFRREASSERPFKRTGVRRDDGFDKDSGRGFKKSTSERRFSKDDNRREGFGKKNVEKKTGERGDRFNKTSERKTKYTGDERKEGFVRKTTRSRDEHPERKPRIGKDDNHNETRFSKRTGTTGRWKKDDPKEERKKARKDETPQKGTIRLNRFIANAGICSRREADDLITAGLVTVNGESVVEMGYQVKPTDDIRYNGERLSREKKVYILLNKPKDAITTVEDPDGRRTVMQLFGNELGERIYPVGRLDRNTTGVLLFTNDGDLAQRLMHPRYEMKKVYKAILNKAFKGEDMWQLTNGVELEDGFIKPDAVAYPNPNDKKEIGVEIHSGKNRIIHRMFESLDYKVDKLDRVLYAGLTKGKLKRGEWRELTEKEIGVLKRTLKLS